MTSTAIPLPPELDHHFELAPLAVLEAALLATEYALIAAHPEMRDAETSIPLDAAPDTYWVATVMLRIAGQLHHAITDYKKAAERERQGGHRQQEFPF